MKLKIRSLPPLPSFGPLVRQHFLSGVMIIIPFWVVGWIMGAVIRNLIELKKVLPIELQPEGYLEDPYWILFLDGVFLACFALLLVLGISLIGWVSRQLIGKQILFIIANVINRIPVVRSIYSALDQLLRTFAGDGTQQFNRVVYVEWPRPGLWAIAFVTAPVKTRQMPEGMLNIFIPTTPNPTSGFHMMVSEKEVRDAQMTVEEAFKVILSLGIAK